MSSKISATKLKYRCLLEAVRVTSGQIVRRFHMPTLGQELARLRKLKGWTLREVEEKSQRKVSNSYLYQLENDNVKEPSPHILYELSGVYHVEYAALMELAGFVMPRSKGKSPSTASVAFSALNLSGKEEEEVLDFIEFLRRKKRKRTDEDAT